MKIIGINFLEQHQGLQKQLNLDSDHIIVDRKDWETVLRFFNDNQEASVKVQKLAEHHKLDAKKGNYFGEQGG